MTGGQGPARGYSWPPFEPGHTLSIKHGARSPRMLAPVVERLRSDLATAAPWTTGPAFAAVVAAWAHAEAQCVLLREYLDEVGLLDDNGEPRPAIRALQSAEHRAASRRSELGLTPSAWAQLHRTLTVGPDGTSDAIESLRATGRAIAAATIETDEEP